MIKRGQKLPTKTLSFSEQKQDELEKKKNFTKSLSSNDVEVKSDMKETKINVSSNENKITENTSQGDFENTVKAPGYDSAIRENQLEQN